MANSIDDIRKQAALVFGDTNKAEGWLNSPLAIFNFNTPYSMLGAKEGVYEVQKVLNKIKTDGFP